MGLELLLEQVGVAGRVQGQEGGAEASAEGGGGLGDAALSAGDLWEREREGSKVRISGRHSGLCHHTKSSDYDASTVRNCLGGNTRQRIGSPRTRSY